MSHKNFGQPSFADAFVKVCSKGGGFLDAISKTFDWSAFAWLLSKINGETRGALGYPPLTMFKIVLLQQWYTLSDPAAEEAVRDRLSFRRFCGIPLDAETPDHSSIWRFRQTIEKLGLAEKLLAEVNRQLDARKLIVRKGTLVDATIIAAAVAPPPYEEGQVNERDPDAAFTKKNGKSYFGYKALAVDEESGLVRQAEMSSADLHDSQKGEKLIQGDEKAFYANKAYDGATLRQKLKALKIADRIAFKGERNKPLVKRQVWFNKTTSRVRCAVERANATMKRWYGMTRVCYLGLSRNDCHLRFVVCARNMKRAPVLLAA
jgi:IS5 family transposase